MTRGRPGKGPGPGGPGETDTEDMTRGRARSVGGHPCLDPYRKLFSFPDEDRPRRVQRRRAERFVFHRNRRSQDPVPHVRTHCHSPGPSCRPTDLPTNLPPLNSISFSFGFSPPLSSGLSTLPNSQTPSNYRPLYRPPCPFLNSFRNQERLL